MGINTNAKDRIQNALYQPLLGTREERERERTERRRRVSEEGMASVAAEMAEHYLFAAIVASILAFLLLAGIRGRKAARGRKRTDDGAPFAAGKEQCDSDADGCGVPDVIVVGAGVAGSALAYTLGKVTPFLPFLS